MDRCPLVSIVIPAFNHARHLDEAIQSVLHQDYSNIELIVLDDGSTDNTREVLKNYGGRFYWESQTNIGQAQTLNKGWQMSKGEILSYLSADDALLPHAVSTSVEYLRSNLDIVLTYCDFYLITPESKIVETHVSPEFNYYDMVVRYVCHPGPGPFFRRHAFEAAGLWDRTLQQMPDYDYWLRLGLIGKFLKIPQVLASHRVYNESLSRGPAGIERAEEPVRIVSKFFQRQQVSADVLRYKTQALSNAHLISAQLHFRAGRYKAGYLHLKWALALYWRNLMTIRAVKVIANGLLNRLV